MTILTRGSEFLMVWISWSQTWATRRTTTTSRNPLRFNSENFRWKRMYLLLRADQRLKQNHKDALLPAHLQELYPLAWTDIEPETFLPIDYPVSKQLSTLLRHGNLPREEDGAIEFWRLKDDLRNKFEHSQDWFDEEWKNTKAGGGGNKKRFQYCTDPSGQEIFYLRALQGHSGRNLNWSFITGQCINSEGFLRVHFITSDVQSIYIPSWIQDW